MTRIDLKRTLKFVNCQAEYPMGRGRIVLGVLVCATCGEIAEHLLNKAEHELSMLRTLLRESLRISIVEGRMNLPPPSDKEPSKEDVLRAILSMRERGT